MPNEILIACVAALLVIDVLAVGSIALVTTIKDPKLLAWANGNLRLYNVVSVVLFLCAWALLRTIASKSPQVMSVLPWVVGALSALSLVGLQVYRRRLQHRAKEHIKAAELLLAKLANGPAITDTAMDETLLKARLQLYQSKSLFKPQKYDSAQAMSAARKDALWYGFGWAVVYVIYDLYSQHHLEIAKELFIGSFVGGTMFGISILRAKWASRGADNTDGDND